MTTRKIAALSAAAMLTGIGWDSVPRTFEDRPVVLGRPRKRKRADTHKRPTNKRRLIKLRRKQKHKG